MTPEGERSLLLTALAENPGTGPYATGDRASLGTASWIPGGSRLSLTKGSVADAIVEGTLKPARKLGFVEAWGRKYVLIERYSGEILGRTYPLHDEGECRTVQ